MSLRKRVKGDYFIESIDPADSITITPGTSGSVVVDGDLTVNGVTTTVNNTNLEIVDNEIVLNSGETGLGVTAGTSGIIVDRGTAPEDAGIRFNESSDVWEYNNGDGGGWQTWAAGGTGTPGGLDAQIQYNNGGLFGGAPITYNDTTEDVTLVAGTGGNLVVGQAAAMLQQVGDEVALASHSKLYAKAPGEGETGLYVSNSSVAGEELITKAKAIVYSIIF